MRENTEFYFKTGITRFARDPLWENLQTISLPHERSS